MHIADCIELYLESLHAAWTPQLEQAMEPSVKAGGPGSGRKCADCDFVSYNLTDRMHHEKDFKHGELNPDRRKGGLLTKKDFKKSAVPDSKGRY